MQQDIAGCDIVLRGETFSLLTLSHHRGVRTRGIRNDPCDQWTYKIELDSLRSVLSAGYVGRYRWVHRKPFYPSWRVPFPLSDSLGKPCV